MRYNKWMDASIRSSLIENPTDLGFDVPITGESDVF